jgi:hypothetical protein
MALEIF